MGFKGGTFQVGAAVVTWGVSRGGRFRNSKLVPKEPKLTAKHAQARQSAICALRPFRYGGPEFAFQKPLL
jgi:hypothetical protein